MARSFLDELNGVLKSPEDIEREKAEALKKHQQEDYENRLSEALEDIKHELLDRAKNGKYSTYNGKRFIAFVYLMGLKAGDLPLVDVSVSEWSGKHTYTLTLAGRKIYSDLERLCALEGIKTERYLTAFTERNIKHSRGCFGWHDYFYVDNRWDTTDAVLKAPCQNGRVHWGQDHEGLAVKVTVFL